MATTTVDWDGLSSAPRVDNSVLMNWLFASPGYLIGTDENGQYYRVPKADGGYDYYRMYGGEGNTQVSSISADDLYRATGFQEEGAAAAAAAAAKEAQRIKDAILEWEQNKKEQELKKLEGQTQFKQQRAQIAQSRDELGRSRDEGLSSNQAYFSGISPDAMQSQMGNYNLKVMDAYQEGLNTAANNEALVGQAENIWNQRMAMNDTALSNFDPTTGYYTGNNKYAVATPTPASLVAYNANLPSQNAARFGNVPQWAPNYGGMSTQQAAKEKDPLSKYMNA